MEPPVRVRSPMDACAVSAGAEVAADGVPLLVLWLLEHAVIPPPAAISATRHARARRVHRCSRPRVTNAGCERFRVVTGRLLVMRRLTDWRRSREVVG
jgi:hypothetical protein